MAASVSRYVPLPILDVIYYARSTRGLHTSRGRWHSAAGCQKVDLWKSYEKMKQSVEAQIPTRVIKTHTIFANNETDFSDIEVYGFDYDYTLASYKESLNYLLYNLGREALVGRFKYPKAISNTEYDPNFAVRGLHFDVRKGLLLKIDAFHNIQMGTVYRGLQRVPDDEVLRLYGGTHVPVDMMSFHGTSQHMHQLMDMFALPEMTLLANVIEYFAQNNIAFDAQYVFHDVRGAVQGVHASGELHQRVMDDVTEYIEKGPQVAELLNRLSDQGKQLFLITNSGYPFVDRGMTYILGKQWHDMFDVIITNARKPKFYNEVNKPFRLYDRHHGVQSWGSRVTEMKKGQIYQEGNLKKLQELTQWDSHRVMYIGDHVYSDLADPTLKLGWRTGAIIPELESEIETINSEKFKRNVIKQQGLQSLIARMQVHTDPESQQIIHEWMRERNALRVATKEVFNRQFGSLFRTYHNPTYFTRRLSRFADIYTSSVVNLLKYSTSHTFYPRRAALPHEHDYHIE